LNYSIIKIAFSLHWLAVEESEDKIEPNSGINPEKTSAKKGSWFQ
jgi:hypothetical protein